MKNALKFRGPYSTAIPELPLAIATAVSIKLIFEATPFNALPVSLSLPWLQQGLEEQVWPNSTSTLQAWLLTPFASTAFTSFTNTTWSVFAIPT
jgi:hypothetical protein